MIQATLPRRSTPPLDLGGVDLNRLARQALQPWADAYDTWRSGLDDVMRPLAKTGRHHCECGCPSCRPDPCACKCCVTDADLVVEMRFGERRIVPIVIENPWRRERDIELELSSWTSIGAEFAVRGEIVTDTTFKLAPCGRAEVVLMIGTATEKAGDNVGVGKILDTKKAEKARLDLETQPRQLPDVTRCEVAYADLRIKGCDMRSIRIAVAVLPRSCEAFTVDCGCACCC
jgi:hypothetical protein